MVLSSTSIRSRAHPVQHVPVCTTRHLAKTTGVTRWTRNTHHRHRQLTLAAVSKRTGRTSSGSTTTTTTAAALTPPLPSNELVVQALCALPGIDDATAQRIVASALRCHRTAKFLRPEVVTEWVQFLTTLEKEAALPVSANRSMAAYVLKTRAGILTLRPSGRAAMLSSASALLQQHCQMTHSDVVKLWLNNPVLFSSGISAVQGMLECCQEQGWGQDEIKQLLLKAPRMLTISSETLRENLKILKDIGIDSSQIFTSPRIFHYGLGRRQTKAKLLYFEQELGLPLQKLITDGTRSLSYGLEKVVVRGEWLKSRGIDVRGLNPAAIFRAKDDLFCKMMDARFPELVGSAGGSLQAFESFKAKGKEVVQSWFAKCGLLERDKAKQKDEASVPSVKTKEVSSPANIRNNTSTPAVAAIVGGAALLAAGAAAVATTNSKATNKKALKVKTETPAADTTQPLIATAAAIEPAVNTQSIAELAPIATPRPTKKKSAAISVNKTPILAVTAARQEAAVPMKIKAVPAKQELKVESSAPATPAPVPAPLAAAITSKPSAVRKEKVSKVAEQDIVPILAPPSEPKPVAPRSSQPLQLPPVEALPVVTSPRTGRSTTAATSKVVKPQKAVGAATKVSSWLANKLGTAPVSTAGKASLGKKQ